MATQNPISTVSYNSEAFLKEKLDSWVEAHWIQAYMYIAHKGEDGDKDHFHVRIEPNRRLDAMDLTAELQEWVDDNGKPISKDIGKKPRGCRPWRPSKEEDAVLYYLHDPDYLAIKYQGGEKGEKLPYTLDDLKVSEGYDKEIAFIRAKAYLEHTQPNLAMKLQKGEKPLDLIKKGENVFTVNAMARALYENDYVRLVGEYEKLQEKYNKLVQAVKGAGLDIKEGDDGNVTIV